MLSGKHKIFLKKWQRSEQLWTDKCQLSQAEMRPLSWCQWQMNHALTSVESPRLYPWWSEGTWKPTWSIGLHYWWASTRIDSWSDIISYRWLGSTNRVTYMLAVDQDSSRKTSSHLEDNNLENSNLEDSSPQEHRTQPTKLWKYTQ